MPTSKGNTVGLVEAVEKLVREKAAVLARERELVSRLTTTLKVLGYQVVGSSGPALGGQDGLLRGPRPDRKGTLPARVRGQQGGPMSAAARKAVSPRMKAYWTKRKAKGLSRRKV